LQEDRLEIVIDTDFPSSFLKIHKLELIRDFFNVESISIPLAVFSEIAKTNLVDLLLKVEWIKIRTVQLLDFSDLNNNEIKNLGGGEKECMALCKTFSKHIMLVNDKKARMIAKKNGIIVLNISGFLFACKKSNFLDKDENLKIIGDLKYKDYYIFSKEELEKIS
jgi:predicted nucleic acid-binding protein